MPRFVLYYRGRQSPPAEHLSQIKAIQGVQIIDEASSHLLLVDGPEEQLRQVIDSLPDWTISPERLIGFSQFDHGKPGGSR